MMAYHGSIFTIFILLFALLAIASASDYGYGSTPNIERSKPKIELDNKTSSIKLDYEVSKPKIDYEHSLTPKIEKSKSETVSKSNLTKSHYEILKLETDYGYNPTPKIEKLKSEAVYTINHTKSDNKISKPKINYGYGPTPKFEKPGPKEIYTTDYDDPESETDYVYSPTPKIEKLKSKVVYKPNTTKPDYELPRPKTNYAYPPIPKIEKSKPKTDYKLRPTELDNEVPKPKESNKLQQPTTTIGVQGVILCKSGSNYFPIQGAVARVTCECVNELGNKTSHISKLSHATDNKGYYFAKMGSKLKINGCKAYLESSPLEICKVPTNVNHGISGATLSSYRLLENNVKLYTVAPFFYTSHLTT
ncbi:unnamed protein product [Trifolium pratense]|uniref:Uncharacterized protein n=1 Tax=Trifolium pratense TaxID=57577 RepID=A0ACB0IAN7_TRIPR|nr:unnamed protein product [Trifolium pratense]